MLLPVREIRRQRSVSSKYRKNLGSNPPTSLKRSDRINIRAPHIHEVRKVSPPGWIWRACRYGRRQPAEAQSKVTGVVIRPACWSSPSPSTIAGPTTPTSDSRSMNATISDTAAASICASGFTKNTYGVSTCWNPRLQPRPNPELTDDLRIWAQLCSAATKSAVPSSLALSTTTHSANPLAHDSRSACNAVSMVSRDWYVTTTKVTRRLFSATELPDAKGPNSANSLSRLLTWAAAVCQSSGHTVNLLPLPGGLRRFATCPHYFNML